MITRRSAGVSRAISVVALAYALALQIFLGGLVAGLHAAPAAPDALAQVAICAPQDGAHTPGTLGSPESNQHHDPSSLCCILGCGPCGGSGPLAQAVSVVGYQPVAASLAMGREPIGPTPLAATGPLGARAPPVLG